MATLGNNSISVVQLSGGGVAETWTRTLNTPLEGDVTFTGSLGSVLIVPSSTLLLQGDADSGMVVTEGGGANGGDLIELLVDNVVVFAGEILAGGLSKVSTGDILDPLIYRPTPQTTAQLTALIPSAVNGDIAFDSDLDYHVKFNGVSWVALSDATTIVDDLTTGGTSSALSAEQGKTLQDTKVNKPTLLTDAGKVLIVNATGDDVEYAVVDADEVIESAVTLTGAAPLGAKYGVDTVTGATFYVSGGSWTPSPTVSVDLNTTISDETGSNGTGLIVPTSSPVTPDIGDLHIEIYNDVTLYFTATATDWLTPSVVEVARDIIDASGFSENLAVTDTTLQAVANKFDVYSGNDRVFLDDTTVAPATAGEPTLLEIATAKGASIDTILFYTGTDTDTDTITYVYHVDKAGVVTLLEKPSVSPVLEAQTLTDAATIVWDASLGENATVTIGATGRTVTISNVEAGKFYSLLVNGSNPFELSSVFKKQNGFTFNGYTPSFSGVTHLMFFSPDGVNLYDVTPAYTVSDGANGYKSGSLIIDNEDGSGNLSSNGTQSFLNLIAANSYTAVQEQSFTNTDIASLSFFPRQRVKWTESADTNRTLTAVTGYNTDVHSPYMVEFYNSGTLSVTFTLPSEFKKTDGTTDVGTVTVAPSESKWHLFMVDGAIGSPTLRRMYPADSADQVASTNISLIYAQWGSRTQKSSTGNIEDYLTADLIGYDPDGVVVADGTFTSPQAGLYRFDIQIDARNNTTNGDVTHFTSFHYTLNGGTPTEFSSLKYRPEMNDSTAGYHWVSSGLLDLSAGDTVRFSLGDDAPFAVNNVQTITGYDIFASQLPNTETVLAGTVTSTPLPATIYPSWAGGNPTTTLAQIGADIWTATEAGRIEVTSRHMFFEGNGVDAYASLMYSKNGVRITGSRVDVGANNTSNRYPFWSMRAEVDVQIGDVISMSGFRSGNPFTVGATRDETLGTVAGTTNTSSIAIQYLPVSTVVMPDDVPVDNAGVADGNTLIWNAANGQYEPSAAAGGSTQDYSNTEIDTGRKWIDGKTVYEISGFISGVLSSNVVLLPSGVQRIIESYGSVEAANFSAGSAGWPVSLSGTAFSSARVRSGALEVFSSASISNLSYTIRYTKV